MVRRRRQEADESWWYDLRIHLPAASYRYGRLSAEPAPASRCEPVPGQDYSSVPTQRHGVAPDWTIEQPLHFGPDTAHERTAAVTADQARTALTRPDAVPCPICRPDRPLRGGGAGEVDAATRSGAGGPSVRGLVGDFQHAVDVDRGDSARDAGAGAG